MPDAPTITRRFWPTAETLLNASHEQRRAIDLHECVVIAECRDHDPSLGPVNSEVMRHAISFPSASVIGQREDRRLSKDVHGRDVVVQIREDWSQSLSGIQLL